YDWVNVPSNAWIDEDGRLGRPNDPGFAGEYFRGMMEPGFDFKLMMAEYGAMRDGYLDAVRAWFRNGPANRWGLTVVTVRDAIGANTPFEFHSAASRPQPKRCPAAARKDLRNVRRSWRERLYLLGPSAVPPPVGVTTHHVESAAQLQWALGNAAKGADVIVMT